MIPEIPTFLYKKRNSIRNEEPDKYEIGQHKIMINVNISILRTNRILSSTEVMKQYEAELPKFESHEEF